MTERKYKFQKPRGTDEYLEAIYEELSPSPQEGRHRPTETIKDHLDALLYQAKKTERQRKEEKEEESHAISWALGALAVLTIIFLFNGLVGSGDWEWLNHHRFAIRLWGIVFASVFLGVSIERSSFFKSLWAFGFTKLVASVALSALVVFSTGQASSLINSVFPVDASALPFTRALVAGLLVFQYSYPLLVVVALFAIFHALHAVDWIKSQFSSETTYKLPPLQSFAFLLLSIVIFWFSTKWVNRDFSEKLWPAKVYRLAHLLDLNGKYECKNLKPGLKVVFLGPEQSRVLVDISSTQTDNIESFVDGQISNLITVPERFYVRSCELESQKKDD